MWKVISVVLFTVVFCSSIAVAQEAKEGSNPSTSSITGHLNLGFKWGLSVPTNAGSIGNDSLLFPVVNVPVFSVGYQYATNKRMAINSQVFVGFHPFNYKFTEDQEAGFFGENGFYLPYFGASFQLYRTFESGWYVGGGIEFHLNTTRAYRFTTETEQDDWKVQEVIFKRNLQEYSGVQRGATLAFGKEFKNGALRGFDVFLFVNYLDRAKLSVEYAVNRPRFFTNVSYKGNVNGLGVRYHFRAG